MWKLGKTSQPRETGMKVEKDTHIHTGIQISPGKGEGNR